MYSLSYINYNHGWSDILLFKCPFKGIQEYNFVWEENWEHCNMHDRNKQQLSTHTQKPTTKLQHRIPGCPLLAVIYFLHVVAWNEEVLEDTRLAVHKQNTYFPRCGWKYLYRSDNTESIAVIRDYFRICATQTELCYSHSAYIQPFASSLELKRLKFVTPFLSIAESILCLPCVDLYWHPQWDFN